MRSNPNPAAAGVTSLAYDPMMLFTLDTAGTFEIDAGEQLPTDHAMLRITASHANNNKVLLQG